MTDHLVEWDRLDLRVRGDKLQQLAQQFLLSGKAPIEKIRMTFFDGFMVVEGSIRKVFAIPFRVEIRRIEPDRGAVHVFIDRIAAFGLPVPALIRSIAGSQMQSDVMKFDAESNRMTIFLDRFLPPFVSLDLREIRPIEGGLSVVMAAGGADLPPSGGF